MSGTTSYAVSARLTIGGNYQAVMRQLGASLATLNRQIDATERNLQQLGNLFAGLSRKVSASATASAASLSKLQAAVSGVAPSIQGTTRSLNAQTRAMQRNTQAAQATTVAANAQAAAMRSLAAVPPVQRLPRPPRGGAGGAGGAGAGAGGAGRRHNPLLRTVDAAAGSAAHGTLRPLAVQAGALGVVDLVQSVIQQGGALQNEMAFGREQVGPENQGWFDRLRRQAEETVARVPGTNLAGNISAGMELRTDIPDREQVLQFLGPMQEIAQLITTMRGSPAEGAAGNIGRFLNLRGAASDPNVVGQTDYARLARETELLSRSFVAFRGLDPREYVGYAQQARVSAQAASEEQLYGGFTTAGIRTFGGERFGTGQAAFTRQFVNGVMTKETAEQLKKIGLISPNARAATVTDAEINRMVERRQLTEEEAVEMRGRPVQRFARRDMFRADIAASNQEEWQRLAREQMGRNGVNVQSPRALDAVSQQIGGTSTAKGFLQWLFDETGRAADLAAMRDVRPGAGQRILQNSYSGGLNAVIGGWNSLLQSVGESGALVRLLHELGSSFRELGEWVRQNPGFMDGVVNQFRQFLREVRQFAVNLAEIVGSVAAIMRSLGLISAARPGPNDGREMPAPERPPGQAPDAPIGGGLRGRLRNWIDPYIRPLLPERLRPPGPGGGDSLPGQPRAQQAAMFSPLPPAGGDTMLRTVINLDGREIADVVSRHQGRAANGPPAAARGHDRRRGGFANEPRVYGA